MDAAQELRLLAAKWLDHVRQDAKDETGLLGAILEISKELMPGQILEKVQAYGPDISEGSDGEGIDIKFISGLVLCVPLGAQQAKPAEALKPMDPKSPQEKPFDPTVFDSFLFDPRSSNQRWQ